MLSNLDLKNRLGVWLKGISLNIDLVDYCPLACPTCAVGSIGARKPSKMDFDTFRKVLDWAGHIRRVMLYVYSDPCVVPDLHLYVQECTDRGIDSWISTTLQKSRCDFAKVIEARPTEFRISFAGWNKMARYQKNARVEEFMDILYEVSSLPRHPETQWTLLFQKYRSNAGEVGDAKALADRLGMKFVALPCIFMVGERVVDKLYTPQDQEIIQELIETPEDVLIRVKRTDSCLMWKQITLNAKGEIYLCQLLYEDRFKIGDFRTHTRKEIVKLMKSHPYCQECLKVGMNVYQYCYGEITKYDNPVEKAESRRRAIR